MDSSTSSMGVENDKEEEAGQKGDRVSRVEGRLGGGGGKARHDSFVGWYEPKLDWPIG